MSKLLPNGIGTPYIQIFSGNNKLITLKDGTSLGEYVADFRYEYDEEGDDNCRITFETKNTKIADNPQIQTDGVIFVRWGYIDGEMSPKRMVAIRDTYSKYSNDGFQHTLICTDKASYLKTIQTETINTEGFISWLKQVNRSKFKDVVISFDIPGLNLGGANKPTILDDGTSRAYLNELTGFITTPIDNTAVATTNKAIVPAGSSVWKTIKTEIEQIPDGPYVMDGRDGNLDIRKRNFDQPPIRTYNINSEAGDMVISFEPETKIKLHDTEIANYAVTDPTTNEANITEEINLDPLAQKNQKLYNSLDTYGKGTYELLQTLKWNYQDSQITGEKIDPTAIIANEWENLGEINTATQDYVEDGSAIKSAIDNTATIIRGITIPKAYYWDSEYAADILTKMIENEITEEHFKKYQATLLIIGDPDIQCNRTIYMGGNYIANKHQGKYYITRCTHSIGKMGYTCEISLYNNPTPINFIRAKYTDPLKQAWEKKTTMEIQEGQKAKGNFNFYNPNNPQYDEIDPKDWSKK